MADMPTVLPPAPTATTTMPRTRAHPMAITERTGSSAASLLVLAPGSVMATMAADGAVATATVADMAIAVDTVIVADTQAVATAAIVAALPHAVDSVAAGSMAAAEDFTVVEEVDSTAVAGTAVVDIANST